MVSICMRKKLQQCHTSRVTSDTCSMTIGGCRVCVTPEHCVLKELQLLLPVELLEPVLVKDALPVSVALLEPVLVWDELLEPVPLEDDVEV